MALDTINNIIGNQGILKSSPGDDDIETSRGQRKSPNQIIGTQQIINNNDAYTSTTSDTYVKVKEIKLTGIDQEGVQIYLKWYALNQGKTRIYVNGVAVSDEYNVSFFGSEHTYTVTGLKNNDLIQLYAHDAGGGSNCEITYFRVEASKLYQEPTIINTLT